MKINFFIVLRLMDKFLSLFRRFFYNFIFNTKFSYFGKSTNLEIIGRVEVGNNVYIGNNVSIIVEEGASLVIGDNSFIGENCYIKCFGGNIRIGNCVSINSKSFLNGCGGLSIASNTRIGTQTIIIASNHKFDDPNILIKDSITKKGIEIGENVWFGARVTVLDGVKVCNDSVVGACSLVSKNIETKGVYVGIPIKKIHD